MRGIGAPGCCSVTLSRPCPVGKRPLPLAQEKIACYAPGMDTPLSLLLTSRRASLGVRQEDIVPLLAAAGVVVVRQAVSTWETGKSVPGPVQWRAVCAVYRLTMLELASAIAGDRAS